MTFISQKDIIEPILDEIAQEMVIAATTAPKGKGVSNLKMALAKGDTIHQIADKLESMADEYDIPFFKRDADNIRSAHVVFLIGTTINAIGLKKCGMCGFPDCETKNEHPHIPCVFNTGDLGIAIGSAVSVAMDHRVDNRIMYTVGQALLELKLLGDDVKVAYAIPLSASAKNPFFDRK